MEQEEHTFATDLLAEDLAREDDVAGESLPKSQESHADADIPADDAEALALLQDILFQSDREQMNKLAQKVIVLERQVQDKDALAAAVAPILGEAIRRQIQDSRSEIVDALYPIIGQIVMKAVTEAIRDLARAIDERVHTALDFQTIWRRLKSLITGVPEGELALRDALPFVVQEILLIHRETGLLLWYGNRSGATGRDTDLVSGMLTAIRDFAQEAMGGHDENSLDELHFGDRLIAIEFARYAYVAVVCDGVPPVAFRADLRRRLYAFEGDSYKFLQHFKGDTEPFSARAPSHFHALREEE